MNSTHKIVKYFAYALAAIIIMSIISLSINIIETAMSYSVDKKDLKIAEKINLPENTNIAYLNVDISRSSLYIIEGETFKVETNSKDVLVKKTNDSLEIIEKGKGFFGGRFNGKIYVYVPKDYHFTKMDINTGAGEVDINYLAANELSFDFGAGKVSVDYLSVLNKANINCGAGQLNLFDSYINNLKLDLGVGEANIKGSFKGNSKIDSGIGSLNIKINDQKEDYKIKVEKGIGTITIDNEAIANEQIYGNGNNFIDIDGGIGSIKIDFLK